MIINIPQATDAFENNEGCNLITVYGEMQTNKGQILKFNSLYFKAKINNKRSQYNNMAVGWEPREEP